jgi:hypothetical protein
MTATDGGSAPPDADAPDPAGHHAPAGLTARSRASRRRTVPALARAEAMLLARNWLVLAGLLAGGLLIWLFIHPVQPLWWNAAWEIGEGQFALAMTVLVAAQLGAGRARRDGMADLYASFPATAGTRTLAHLTSLVGAAPASLLLLGAAAAVVELLGPIGTPSIAVLAGGALLVIAAGAAGVAIGTRFPHPLAGLLGALALFLSSTLFQGGTIWLLPWEIKQDDLGELPSPLAGYPPAGAHVAELAGIAVLAGIAALAVTVSRARARARGALATAGILAVAVICLAGAAQLRPIPTADLNHLIAEVADPASAQRCTTADQVRYCLYPGFGSELPSLEAPVNGVLARLPALPDQPLTIRQVVPIDFSQPSLTDPTLTHGHPERQIAHWNAQLRRAPFANAAASAIYLPVGSWPAAGAPLADAHFATALSAAEWAVHLPPTTGGGNSSVFQPCVPFSQAREAIAIWLAILATHPPASELQDGLHSPGPRGGIQATWVRNTFVPTWASPGAQYLVSSGPSTTVTGYLLAKAMTSLPEQRVAHVLRDAWGRWLSWHTTDAQLAAALGIPMPSLHAVLKPPHARHRVPSPPPPSSQQSPLCTT